MCTRIIFLYIPEKENGSKIWKPTVGRPQSNCSFCDIYVHKFLGSMRLSNQKQQSNNPFTNIRHSIMAAWPPFCNVPSAKRHQRHRWLKVILTHAKDLVKSTKEGHHSSRVAKLNERNSAKKNKVCCIRLLGKKQTWNM